jgi:YggT family protein
MNLALTLADIINVAARVLYLLIIARIVVSWIGLNPWNPIVHWLRVIVDPVLRPFRRILPTFGGIDFSPLLAILVIFFVADLANNVLVAVAVGGQVHLAAIVVGLIANLILKIIVVLAVLVLIRLLLSLFNADPWHPLVAGIRQMSNPIVRPFAALGSPRSRYGHHASVDVPAAATLGLYIALYFGVQALFNNIVIPNLAR